SRVRDRSHAPRRSAAASAAARARRRTARAIRPRGTHRRPTRRARRARPRSGAPCRGRRERPGSRPGWCGARPSDIGPSGPRDTRLDLVDDEEGTRLIAELPEPAQVVLVGDVDPALALDALDEHAGGAVIDRALHRAQVVVGHVLEAGHQWLEAVMVLLLAGGRDRRERAPVERVPRGDELDPVRGDPLAGVLPGELEGR